MHKKHDDKHDYEILLYWTGFVEVQQLQPY